MKTYEMVALADTDGKTYKTGDMFYNKVSGFCDKRGKKWPTRAYEGYADGLSIFIHEDEWAPIESVRISDSVELILHVGEDNGVNLSDGVNCIHLGYENTIGLRDALKVYCD